MASATADQIFIVNKHVKEANPTANPIRIVHISDTHLNHDMYLDEGLIPNGDILIHSGDFDYYRHTRRIFQGYDFQQQVDSMNTFFNKLPHKHKIFVAGNHETNFPWHTSKEIQNALPSVTYLQDSYVDIEGLRIYCSPWTGIRWFSLARAFNLPYSDLHEKWSLIPDNTDVLVTHSSPYGIMDLADLTPWQSLWMSEDPCDICSTTHVLQRHMGSRSLLDTINQQVRPKVHLFGHVHEFNDGIEKDGILYSNAVMKSFAETRARIIDYYIDF